MDYKLYPPDWLTIIRPRIMRRAGERRAEGGEIIQNACCEKCGIENYAIKPNGTKVIIGIAHLDHDPENWEVKDERLQALCQACHLRYDLSRHIMKRKHGADVFKQPTFF